jgi:RNA polymerase sigma-70 factor (ECF subfamily)
MTDDRGGGVTGPRTVAALRVILDGKGAGPGEAVVAPAGRTAWGLRSEVRGGIRDMAWPDEAEIRELLGRVERGEDGAADRLWERHREPLRRMIGLRLDRGLGRRVDASDVVQDVLLKADQRLREYLRDPSVPFHVWLRGLARDQVIDQHRRHRVASRRSVERERPLGGGAGDGVAFADRSSLDLAAQLRDPGPTPAASALRRELERRFREALDRLDGADREIVVLRHFDQLSNGEAARALGLSDAAAGMRYLRALRRLRALLGETPSQSGALRP